MFWEIAEQAIGKLEMPQVTRFSADNNIDIESKKEQTTNLVFGNLIAL